MEEKNEIKKTGKFKIPGRMENDAKERPAYMLVVVLLLALACMLFPVSYLSPYMTRYGASALARFVFGGVGIIFMLMFSFQGYLKIDFKKHLKNLPLILAAVLIAVNNFPIIGLITGDAYITASKADFTLFVLFCVSVGFFEEVFFRGLILPLCLIIFKNDKQQNFMSVLASSLIFGFIHLVNLFGGASPGAVFLQIGYSALIGALCAVLTVILKSIYLPIIVHTVYDIGGLMIGYEGGGLIWDRTTVILTVTVSIIVAAYMIYAFIRHEKKMQEKKVKKNIDA